MRNYSGFYQGLSGHLLYGIHELHYGINAYEENYFASIFKWLWRKNKAFQGQSSHQSTSPSTTLSHTITKKPKRVFLRRKSYWGFWNSRKSSVSGSSLCLIVIGPLWILSDRLLKSFLLKTDVLFHIIFSKRRSHLAISLTCFNKFQQNW